MADSIFYTILLGTLFLLLFASAEYLYHKRKVKAELTRKYVHLFTGILTILFPLLLDSHWYILILNSSFLLILILSLKFKLLPSINAVDRVTRGSILYPFVVYFAFLFYQYFSSYSFYYIPILILAISDPIAALGGKKYPYGSYTTFGYHKTLSGSFGFFISAFFIAFFLLFFIEEMSLQTIVFIALSTAFTTTIAEAMTHKGYDNITIPAAAALVLFLFKSYFIS